jgi:uncharacterized membrane protein
MSTPFATAGAPGAVPATREFSAAWIAYALYASSALFFWPALIALIISYSKRGHPETGFIDSHHRWMLRSFWWSQVWFLVFLALVLMGVWPIVSDVVRQVAATGDWNDASRFNININWTSIFTTVGGAMIGGLGIVATWFWFLYRMLRGMITLADARPMA